MGMDVLAEFGLKMESDAKKAKRPGEHHNGESAETENKNSAKNGAKKSPRKEKKETETAAATEETENN